MNIPTITTPRLALRPFTEADTTALYEILSDPEVLRYFPSSKPPAQEQVARLIAGQLKHWKAHGHGWWAVESRAGGQFMGWCGLQYLPETDEIEVGYLLGKPFWGQGLATEATQASLRYAFEDKGLETIVAIVHPGNRASQRVLEKSGMAFTNEAEYFGMDCYRYVLGRPAFARAAPTWDTIGGKRGLPFEKEIVELHQFFQDWYNGELDSTEAHFARVSRALAPGFSIIFPDGRAMPRQPLLEMLRAAHGQRAHFRIWIENVQRRHQTGVLAVYTYEEWQQTDPDSAPTARLSTVVFRQNPESQNGLVWLHVHETWLADEG
ncbi:MAG: GNAT family N-acetyltransferase [Chloroflexi bacterium]|nr:GNAT family N-acetyltransferase [Chloroflexota bacterium]